MRPRYPQARRGGLRANPVLLTTSRLVWLVCFLSVLLVYALYSSSELDDHLRQEQQQQQQQQHQQQQQPMKETSPLSSSVLLPVVSTPRPTYPMVPLYYFEHFVEDLKIHDVDEEEEENEIIKHKDNDDGTSSSSFTQVDSTPMPPKHAITSAPSLASKAEIEEEADDDDDAEIHTDDQLDLLEEQDEEGVVDDNNLFFSSSSSSSSQGSDSDDSDDYQQDRPSSSNVPLPSSSSSPADADDNDAAVDAGHLQPLPHYSMKHLESLGFGKFLLVYRVLAPTGVFTRTKPLFMSKLPSSLDKASAASMLHELKPHGDVLVGYKLVRESGGLWLKLAPKLWVPITSHSSGSSSSSSSASSSSSSPHKLMKQIMTISLPANLRRYWGLSLNPGGAPNKQLHKPCKHESLCKDKDRIRRGVLQLMRDMKLMTREMDPEALTNRTSAAAATRPSSSSLVAPPAAAADKVKEEAKEDQDEEEEVVVEEKEDEDDALGGACHELTSELDCVQAKCAWDAAAASPKCSVVLIEAASHQARFDVNLTHLASSSAPRYLMYQPLATTADWNVQRLQFENSLILCKLLNRTCVAPPVHSQQQFVAMSRLVNFDALAQVVSVQQVPQHLSFADFVQRHLPPPSSPLMQHVSQVYTKLNEQDAIAAFGTSQAAVLLFTNLTLNSFDWRGTAQGFPARRQVHTHLMYADHVKHMARRISEAMGPYHAVHIHQALQEQSRNLSWWTDSLAPYRDMTDQVYVVNPHGQRAELEPLASRAGLRAVYLADLAAAAAAVDKDDDDDDRDAAAAAALEALKSYLGNFPDTMHGMVSGMVEQLVCGYALMFLGSGSSPFTAYVLRLRKFRDTLATDTRFEDKPLGLPTIARNLKTNCEPIRVVYHDKPC